MSTTLVQSVFGKTLVFAPRAVFIIQAILKMVEKYNISTEDSSPIGWGWYSDGSTIRVFIHEGFRFFNLSEEEVEGFATTSCGPALWVLRALSYRLGIHVPLTDKIYYEIMESRNK